MPIKLYTFGLFAFVQAFKSKRMQQSISYLTYEIQKQIVRFFVFNAI